MSAPAMTPTAPQSLVRPMRAVLRRGLIFGVAALLLGTTIGYAVAGTAGVWGALLGVGISVAFFSLTVAVALTTARLGPQWLGLAVMVSWLVKMAVLVVVLVFLRSADFYSRPVFFVCLLGCTFGYLGLEAWIVSRTKVLYVETEFAPAPEPRP